ncbi:MAG: nuclease domain-containing protein [Solibacillus sp.]
MPSIEKRGSTGVFRYIFDVKYALHIDKQGNLSPKHDDINVMHRYRDAIVAKTGQSYEREMFGAYVLFPGKNDAVYEQHPLYKSISEVNIGGLPFLPNETKLVEQIIDNLLYKNADELQREGILPKGTLSYLTSRQGEMLVLHHKLLRKNSWESEELGPELMIARSFLPQEAIQVKEIAVANDAGIYKTAEVLAVQATVDYVTFTILNEQQHELPARAHYDWQCGVVLPLAQFDAADCFEEIFAKSEAEQKIVRIFKRVSAEVRFVLDDVMVTENRSIARIFVGDILFELHKKEQIVIATSCSFLVLLQYRVISPVQV